MTTIKSFSISWQRNMFRIQLYGLSPSGKQKIIKLHIPIRQVEHLAAELKKAVDNKKKSLSPSDVEEKKTRYIG